MADRYTPEEIQEIFDRYNAVVRSGATVSEALAREMNDAVKGVKNYTLALNTNLKLLGQASKQAAQDMVNGAKGTSVFNSSIEATGNVAKTVASQFGVLGKFIGATIGALTAFLTAVNKQSDALYGNFQQLSRSGAIGAQGMDDVFQNMQRFGYTIDELDKMSAVLTENSQNFAMFSGTAATGSKNLADMVKGMEDSRVKFFNLGMNVDDLARGSAGYFRQLGSLGRANEATTAGAKAYIREMEILTRLTGAQRKELEEARERAELIDSFYASLVDLPKEAQQEALSAYNQLFKIAPKMADEFAANFSGVITGTTDLLMATSGQSIRFNKEFFAAGGRAVDTMQGLGDALGPFRDLRKELALIGAEFGPSFRDTNRFIIKSQQDFGKQLDAAGKEVTDLENGINAATDAQSRTRDNQIKTSNAVQEFINIGVTPLTKAFQYLTAAVEYLTNLIPLSGRAKAKFDKEQAEKAAAAGGPAFSGNQKEFYDQMYKTLLTQATKAGVSNPEVIARLGAAQSALETGYGKSTAGAHNYFGIKARAGDSNAVMAETKEWDPVAGRFVTQKAGFRKYGSMNESAADYIKFLQENQRYRGVLGAGSAEAAIAAQGATGYATDPGYADKLREIHRRNISGAFGFRGTMSGPMSGYSPGLGVLAHGYEEFSIRPMGGTTNLNSGASEGTMIKLIERVDDLISLNRNQLDVSERILKYQQ